MRVRGPLRFARILRVSTRTHIHTRIDIQLSPRAIQSTLAPMNWRRGLLLAGINVAVAIPMIAILAARDAQSRRDWKRQSTSEGALSIEGRGELSAPSKIVPVQEEQTVSFNPCTLWGHVPVQQYVVQLGDMPTFVVTQWRVDCPSKWSLARLLGVDDSGLLSDTNFTAMRRVDVALCLLIAVQWFLIGAYPLIKASRWWSEPGAFITTCTALGSLVALVPVIDTFGSLPVVFAAFAWLWYLALLLWIPVHLAWQSTLHRLRRLS